MTPYTKQLLLVAVGVLFVMSVALFVYMIGPNRMLMANNKGASTELQARVVNKPTLDAHLTGYDATVVRDRLDYWTPDQIATYRGMHLGPDMLFPFVYCGFFVAAAVLGFGCAFPYRILWPWLLVLPVLNLAADYAENYLVSFVIFPAGEKFDPSAVTCASRLTVAKWVLVGFNILVVGAGILASLLANPT